MLCSACNRILQVDPSHDLDENGDFARMQQEEPVPFTRFSDVARNLGLKPQTQNGTRDQLPYYKRLATAQGFRDGVLQSCHICLERWLSLSPDEQGRCNAIAAKNFLTVYCISFENEAVGNEEPNPEIQLYTIFVAKQDGNGNGNGNGDGDGDGDVAYVPWSESHTFYFRTCSDNELDFDISNHFVDSPDALAYKALVNHWLQECTTDHYPCSQNLYRFDIRPKRIIHVLPQPIDAEKMQCKLLDTEETPWEGKYITLSHRWGTANFLRLLTSNVLDFKHHLPTESIPGVFCDTFRVALAFGVEYVWIDSLCILQDSPQDWEEESPNLHAIYSKAHFNVAAASEWSTSDHEKGLFPQRPASLVRPCLIKPQFPALPRSHKNWTENTTLALVSENLITKKVDASALYSRAWTVQERMLAPRVLHFCKEQIFWECFHQVYCETFPTGSKVRKIDTFHHASFPKSRLFFLHRQEPKDTTTAAWAALITEYTRKQWTYSSDRLPAISGLAQLFAKAIKSRYLAGLWLDDLPYQLLWIMDPGRNKILDANNVLVRQGPSWSWASIVAPVIPLGSSLCEEYRLTMHLAKLTNAIAELKIADQMGQVVHAALRLSACICPISDIPIWKNKLGMCILEDSQGTRSTETYNGLAQSLLAQHMLEYSDSRLWGTLIIPDDHQSIRSATHLLLLLIATYPHSDTVIVRGLLVKECTPAISDGEDPKRVLPWFSRCAYISARATRSHALNLFGMSWDFDKKQAQFPETFYTADLAFT